MSATNGSRRCGATTLPSTADSLLGRQAAIAVWRSIPQSTGRRSAGACGPFEGGCRACTPRGEVWRVPRQRVEHIPPPRRRRDAAVGGGGGAVTGRFDSQTADRLVARDSEDRARQGVGLRIFFGFNGHDTHWARSAVPMPGAPRPSCPRCAREECAPVRAQWLAALAATRADPRTCPALRVRPRTATSKAARACRPGTPPARARPALCMTDDRHARSDLQRSDLRRLATPQPSAAHPTRQPRRSRTRPRGGAPCPAH